MNPHRLFGMAVMNVALAAVCSGVNAEGIDIDFNAAIDRAVAMFPMLAGQTYLTVDANRNKVNWMPDAAELYLVHEILAHPELPHHQDVLAAWQANRMQMARDLGGAGTKQDQALGDFLAGLITSNSKNISSISMIFSFVASLGDSQDLSFTSDKYVSLDALLAFNADVREPGDYDGDGVSNNAEFNFALSYGKARYGTFSDGRVKSAFWADDIDGDGLSIYADSDSDGDGLSDGYESNVDQDQFLDYLSMPKDKWMTPNPPTADDIFVNPDADELENFLDTDSDNDGKSDRDEGIADSDGDYIPEFLDGVAGTNPPKPQVPVEPDDVVIQKDIVYGTVDGIDLKLDLARPAKGQGPFPLIVCIHGGGWQLGDKGGYINAIRAFAKRDYVAVSVNYRLAPKHKFPAQIEDVKCAVRYLRSRAEELNINAAMVGATGDSAGGYLSLMLGLLDPKDNLEGACGPPYVPSKVQAVVNFYGGADLRTWRVSPEGEVLVQGSFAKGIDGVIADYVGTADRADPVMAAASPATYADAGDPPILNIHGTADLLVPFEQGKTFHEAATKAGVKSELAVIEGGGHGLSGEMRERSDKLMMDFFDKHLKGIDRAEEARLVEGLYSKRESPVPVQQDIVYAETDGTKLHLDLARPPEGDGPFPLVLCFHGGYYLPNARKDFHREIQDFAEHGYVAASVEYRGIFKGTFPQPVQDGKAALRYLRAHAAEYGIDPARVALWGGSMGGYMALMIGLTGKEDGLDVGDHLDQSSSGQAIIDRYGPTDLQIAETSQMTPERKEMLKASFGTEEVNKELLAKASPITYVDPRDPPVLIIHNPKDTSVPLLQSVALKKALDTAGVPNQMELLRGSWHASELTSKEPGDEADRARARAIELEFLDKYLKRPPNS